MADFLQGMDVSEHNGYIDWASVASRMGVPRFVYLKATEGGNRIDRQYASNRAGATAQELLCGACHFFLPSTPVAQQVANFCNVVGSVQGELPPMLDVEQAGLEQPAYAAAVAQWLQQVGERLGCVPGIYTHTSFWDGSVGSFAPFLAHPLWIAQYGSRPGPALPSGATGYTFWQYTNTGVVNGIAGPVDMSRFAGSPEQLQALRCG